MIETEFRPGYKHLREYSPFFAMPSVLYGINFGLIAGLLNAFLSLQFFGTSSLFFGQIFVLLCLVIKGLNASIIAVLISSITAAVIANDAYLVVIFTLEMLFVHVLLRKGHFLLQVGILYWMAIGVPLYILLHGLTSPLTAQVLFINGITIAINGLFCVAIVAMAFWFLPNRFLYQRYNNKPPSLANTIFSVCMLTVTLPVVVISLFFIWQSSLHNEASVAQNLKNTASQTASLSNAELQRHLDGLNTISQVLQRDSNTPLQSLLAALSNQYQLFSSLIATNSEGYIQLAAPYQFSLRLNSLDKPNVAFRDYFKDAKTSMRPVVSDALVGQGFGSSLLISLAAPVVSNGLFRGIVQGSITLDSLSEFYRDKLSSDYLFVITDNKGRIIARSEQLNYAYLSNFDYIDFRHDLVKQIPSLRFNEVEYLYQQSSTNNGWQITIMQPTSLVTNILVNNFIVLVIATSFALILLALIARALSKKITQPLIDITEHLPNKDMHRHLLEKSRVSSEMLKLSHKLIDSHDVMQNFQQQLSEQVHNKTKQLRQLNKELYSIAQKDSLTQLLNRAGFNRLAITSYRNCIRNHISMSLIFIDIDHFKNINDNHGHPFGDKCIVAVAKTIQKHCKRDTDIIGRYGGEEFIIMIVGGEIDEHYQRIEMIRSEIEKLHFKNGQHTVKMTISAGYCSVNKDFSVEYEDILQLADDQLYQSKREGRNRINSTIR